MTIAKILNFLSIPISALFAIMDLSEYYIVAIVKDFDGYPFGGEGPVPYYYKNANIYSSICLFYGLLFILLMIIGVYNIKKKLINEHLLFGIVCFLIIVRFLHSITD